MQDINPSMKTSNNPPDDKIPVETQRKDKIRNFNVIEYVDSVSIGYTSSVEQFVANLYEDDNTIVHCMNNGVDYPKSEMSSLIDYVKRMVNNQ